jgi:hypothetical protein
MWSLLICKVRRDVFSSEYCNSFGIQKPRTALWKALTWFQDEARTNDIAISACAYNAYLEQYDTDQRMLASRVLTLFLEDPTQEQLDRLVIPDDKDQTVFVGSYQLVSRNEYETSRTRRRAPFLIDWKNLFDDEEIFDNNKWSRRTSLLACYLFSPWLCVLWIFGDAEGAEGEAYEESRVLNFVHGIDEQKQAVPVDSDILAKSQATLANTLQPNIRSAARSEPFPVLTTTLDGYRVVQLFWDNENQEFLVPFLEKLKVSRALTNDARVVTRAGHETQHTTMVLKNATSKSLPAPARITSMEDILSWRRVLETGCCVLCSIAVCYVAMRPDYRVATNIQGMFAIPSNKASQALHFSLLLAHILSERPVTHYHGRLSADVLRWGCKYLNTGSRFNPQEYVYGWDLLQWDQFSWVKGLIPNEIQPVKHKHHCKDDVLDHRQRVLQSLFPQAETTRNQCLQQGFGGGLQAAKQTTT